jgi:hypothetical protein
MFFSLKNVFENSDVGRARILSYTRLWLCFLGAYEALSTANSREPLCCLRCMPSLLEATIAWHSLPHSLHVGQQFLSPVSILYKVGKESCELKVPSQPCIYSKGQG